MDVGEQVVPADDAAVGVSQRKPTRLKPPVFAIKPSDPVLEFVRLSGFNGVLPGSAHAWEIRRVNGVRGAPSPELLKGPAEIREYLAVHVLDLAGRRHHGDEAGNRLDDEAKTLLTHIKHCRSAGETRESSRATLASVRGNPWLIDVAQQLTGGAPIATRGERSLQSRCSGSSVPLVRGPQR